MQIALMHEFHNDAKQKTLAFIGEDANVKAEAAFKEYTGIEFQDYTQRRSNGSEDDIDILGEEKAGSTVEIIDAVGSIHVDIKIEGGNPEVTDNPYDVDVRIRDIDWEKNG